MTDVSCNTERWLPVVGFEGFYEVSNAGRVRSLERTVTWRNGATRTYPSKLLRCTPDSVGYPRVTLGLGVDRKRYFRRVHRMVLTAFMGPNPPDMPDVLHGDGNKMNNTLSNLRWGTPLQNADDARRHAMLNPKPPGERCRLGHRLIAPNLVRSSPAILCRSCHNAYTRRYKAERQGRQFDWVCAANEAYLRIMGDTDGQEIVALGVEDLPRRRRRNICHT